MIGGQVGKQTFRCNVVDVEASGIGSESFPIEIGVVLDDGSEYHAIIKPALSWTHWTQEAQRLHGLDLGYAHTNGKAIETVCEELNRICADKTLYSDCWVYDLPWILKLFSHARITPTFKCSPIESILTEKQILDWVPHKHRTKKQLNLKPHRALNDAKIIASTLRDLVSGAIHPMDDDQLYGPELASYPLNDELTGISHGKRTGYR